MPFELAVPIPSNLPTAVLIAAQVRVIPASTLARCAFSVAICLGLVAAPAAALAAAPVAALAAAPVAAEVLPLPANHQALLQSVAEDPAPKMLLGNNASLFGKHYWASNEWHLELFAAHLKPTGGAYVGVGSDQAYLLMGMTRPEVAWLVDYDADIVMLQRIYRAFFAATADRREFMPLWRADHVATSKDLIRKQLSGRADVAAHLKLFGLARSKIERRLLRVTANFTKAKVASFLTDDATYTWLRQLELAGRIRSLRADLLLQGAIAQIGQNTRQMGLTVRSLYLSNAEGYWNYTPQFRSNIASLPIDDHAVLLRTIGTWNHNFDYIYHVMPMQSYAAWVASDYIHNFRAMVRFRLPKAGEYFALVSPASQPPPAPPPRSSKPAARPPIVRKTAAAPALAR